MLSQERRAIEKSRLIPACRNFNSVKKILSAWLNTSDNVTADPERDKANVMRYREYYVLWTWLEARADAEGKEVYFMKTTPGGVRMTVEYLRMIHEDEIKDFKPSVFRGVCDTLLDDYLMWSESDLGKFVFRTEQLMERERMRKQFSRIRGVMEKGIIEGDKKLLEMWMKSQGMFDGDNGVGTEGYRVEIVDHYPEDGEVRKVLKPEDTSKEEKKKRRAQQTQHSVEHNADAIPRFLKRKIQTRELDPFASKVDTEAETKTDLQ